VGGVDGGGALLAIVAAMSFALAATLWQKASMDAGVEPGDSKGLLGLLTNGVWLLGLLAQGTGVALQAGALDRGRVAIIQPLLVTSIVWALPLGHYLTNQVITRRHIAGAAIIVVGLATFAIVGDPAAGVDNAPTADWISALVVIFAVCIGLMLFARHGGLGTKAAVFGATAGVLYGVAATLMKPTMETWHTDGLGTVLGGWQFWLMVVGGGVGFYLQQVSLATGRLVTSVATVSVVNPVVSVLLGALVLQERLDRDPEWHAVVAIAALAVALLGATLIASASEQGASSTSRPTRPEPALA
jgi:drug/metabolite transporter (DMT)-like permease